MLLLRVKPPLRIPWRSVRAGAALGLLLTNACHSEQSPVQSLSSRDDFDASRERDAAAEQTAKEQDREDTEGDTASTEGADTDTTTGGDMGTTPSDTAVVSPPSDPAHPIPVFPPQGDAGSATSDGESEVSSAETDGADAGRVASGDASVFQRCEPGAILCSESGERERCAEDGSSFERHGSCASELFDGFDSDAVYVRRADGQFAYLSDGSPPPELSEAISSGQTVRRVIADTDPVAHSSPWLIDLNDTLSHPLQGIVASSVLDAHVSHGSTVTVATDGSVTSLLSGVQLPGDFVAALGHGESAWLLSSDGSLSSGLNVFDLVPLDWLPTLPDRYQRVFALDQELCGLRTDGEVDCTPSDTWQGLIPEGLFVDLSCNFRTCYGLRTDGAVSCWSAQFECVPQDGPFLDIATAAQLACGITEDRGVRCWYHNGTALDAQWIDAAYR